MSNISKKMKNLVEISSLVAESTNFFDIKDKIIEKMLEVVFPRKACVNLFYNNDYKHAYLVCSNSLEYIRQTFKSNDNRGVKFDFYRDYPDYIHEAVENKKIIYIKNVFDDLKIGGESLSRYGAGYMWGVMGLVYNPSAVSKEDVRHWSVLLDEKYRKQVTMKDSVRDSYLVALTILKEKKLLSEEFQKAMETTHCLTDELNDTSEQTVTKVQTILEKMRKNSYSLETDSGKADMVTGKVVLNMQWSGDGVYTMDEAEKDGIELSYAVPEEGSNLWFDGFCMMKNGISGDAKKKQAAQAFINYISRPDNVIRNMYYVGYTSVIAGGDSDLIFKYADWCYGAEEDEEEVSPYDLSYFFSSAKKTQNKYVLEVPKSQVSRQVSAQYPEQSVLKRSAVMQCFSEEANRRISRMWIRVRCF